MAEQNSYAGHIRFADAAWDRTRTGTHGMPGLMDAFERAPLASPKPTAGQFYLTSGAFKGKVGSGTRRPLAHWGSEADDQEARPIAGRKFYWATVSPTAKRGHRTTDDAERLCAEVRPVRPGAVFTTRVTFDNLDRLQLAELLISVDPSLLWPQARSRLGGGRPFGWGTVRMEIDQASLRAAGPDRYLAGSAAKLEIRQLVEDYRRKVGSRPQWAALRVMLTPDQVSDPQIAYPTVNGDPFAFWRDGSGWTYESKKRLLASPPMATAECR